MSDVTKKMNELSLILLKAKKSKAAEEKAEWERYMAAEARYEAKIRAEEEAARIAKAAKSVKESIKYLILKILKAVIKRAKRAIVEIEIKEEAKAIRDAKKAEIEMVEGIKNAEAENEIKKLETKIEVKIDVKKIQKH